MRKKRLTTQKMAMIGVMAAFYVVLSLYVAAIKLGNVKITFASVPTILMATLFGPLEGMLTAAIGSFICQMISYGFTATTVLWILPPVFRACMVGFMAKAISRDGKKPEEHKVLFPACIVLAAVITTAVNTFVIWADSVIYGYYTYAYVFGQTVARFITGIATAVAVSLIITTVIRPLRKVVSK